jgi:hypothetical protein
MSELAPEPDSTGDENQKRKAHLLNKKTKF